MKVIKWLVILLVVLAAVVFGGGMLLKDDVHVERSIQIDRPPAEVFAVLSSIARFNEWSPWRDYDPTAKQEFSGPDRGVGGKLSWKGDKGSGTMEITEVVENAKVSTSLDFGADGKAISHWVLSGEGSGTKVTWSFDSSFEGDLIGRWFGLMMDGMIGPEYERGLKDLKTLVESTPAPQPEPPAAEPAEAEPAAEGEQADPADAQDEEAEQEAAAG